MYKKSITVDKIKTRTPEGALWMAMNDRCSQGKEAYKECKMSEEFLDFQKFAEWCNNQVGFNQLDEKGRRYQLDKDVLGDSEYSPNTCVFLPKVLNLFFVQYKKENGLPKGVHYHKGSDRYVSVCGNNDGSYSHLGYFKTPALAFAAYKEKKEAVAKLLAEKYKDFVDGRVYQKLLCYNVSIDD